MEGIFYYWFFWGFWIYITFIMKKGKNRTFLSFLVLGLIVLAHLKVVLFDITLTIAFILSLFIAYYIVAIQSVSMKFYLFVICLMVTLIYVGFELFQLYDPVIIMFHSSWMSGIFIAIIVLSSIRDLKFRIISTFIGASHGDLIFSLFLRRIYVDKTVGSVVFFEVIAITVLLLLMWTMLERAIAFIGIRVKQLDEIKRAEL